MRPRLVPRLLIAALLIAGGGVLVPVVPRVQSAASSPQMTISPAHATTGTRITATVTGLPVDQGVLVYYNRTATWPGSLACWKGVTDQNGNTSCTFTLPSSASGSFPIVAIAE